MIKQDGIMDKTVKIKRWKYEYRMAKHGSREENEQIALSC